MASVLPALHLSSIVVAYIKFWRRKAGAAYSPTQRSGAAWRRQECSPRNVALTMLARRIGENPCLGLLILVGIRLYGQRGLLVLYSCCVTEGCVGQESYC